MTGLLRAFERLSSRRVLLIGDTILDVYTYGKAMGLSSETPTIVARKGETRRTLGGAAFTGRNLAALGSRVHFLTLVGNDEEAAHVRNFSTDGLEMMAVEAPGRPTTVKHRFWVDGYKLFQLDTRDDSPIDEATAGRVLESAGRVLSDVDAVVISDYRHGMLTSELIPELLKEIRRHGKPYYVDSQVAQRSSNHTMYRPDGIICLNVKEARCIDPAYSPSDSPASFDGLCTALDTDRIVVKLGEEGAIMRWGGQVLSSPSMKVQVVDTTGAGDAFLAAFCLAGADDPASALWLANAWAGLSIEIHGTHAPSKGALEAAVLAAGERTSSGAPA